jgi:hypothetical protein
LRKRNRPSCQFGNYHHYYGYRLKPEGFEDPRLKVRMASDNALAASRTGAALHAHWPRYS